jgi:hypothetical protein
MSIIKFTPEEISDPYNSDVVMVHDEDAEDCYGDACGNYHEQNGRALRPPQHSHLVVTGKDPATTSRRYAISK